MKQPVLGTIYHETNLRSAFLQVKHVGQLRWLEVQSKFRVKHYHGLAGSIRRKLVISVALALAIGELAILIGILLREMEILPPPQSYFIVGLLFLVGLFSSGWLMLRLMDRPLHGIEHVEDSLIEMSSTSNFKLEQNQQIDGLQTVPLVRAYYAMTSHMDAIENDRLEYLSRMSHEIRSPLASILGYNELLADLEMRRSEGFIDSCYRVISKEGMQINRLIEDVVLAAGIDAGHYVYEMTPFHMDRLLESLIGDFQKTSNRKINFENKIGETIIVGDVISLREAIRKIIDNGLKFSPPDKSVVVTLQKTSQPGWIEILVRDFGIGIDEIDKMILFRRFGRVRNEETAGIPGSGLGLYIAKNFIEKHNGSITISSKLDEGSTFALRLPITQRDIK
jgi:signal transduction histidine kinase